MLSGKGLRTGAKLAKVVNKRKARTLQADGIVPGMILARVDTTSGQVDTDSMPYKAILQTLHSAERPITLGFREKMDYFGGTPGEDENERVSWLYHGGTPASGVEATDTFYINLRMEDGVHEVEVGALDDVHDKLLEILGVVSIKLGVSVIHGTEEITEGTFLDNCVEEGATLSVHIVEHEGNTFTPQISNVSKLIMGGGFNGLQGLNGRSYNCLPGLAEAMQADLKRLDVSYNGT